MHAVTKSRDLQRTVQYLISKISQCHITPSVVFKEATIMYVALHWKSMIGCPIEYLTLHYLSCYYFDTNTSDCYHDCNINK
jgi:hypothetical protein